MIIIVYNSCYFHEPFWVVDANTVTKSLKTLLVFDSGSSFTAAIPCPASFPTRGSIGKVPRKGILAISASDFPPPLEKIFVHSLQVGH